MADALSEQELSSFRHAFSRWDTTGGGTIQARDLCSVLEFLGKEISPVLRSIYFDHGAEDDQLDFDEFLCVVAGPPTWSTIVNHQEDLSEVVAAHDDGTGHIALRDLLRVMQDYMEGGICEYTDSEMVEVYRQSLDVSQFGSVGGSLSPGKMWKVFETEFFGLREEQETANATSAATGLRAAADGEPTCETADMINVTVVDLSGEQLMVDTIASSWSVQALQQHIEAVVGAPVHRQALFLEGDDGFSHGLCASGTSLSKSGVSDGSTLLLIKMDELRLDYKKFIAKLREIDL